MKFQVISLVILISSFIMAQEEPADTSLVDTVMDSIVFEESTTDTAMVTAEDTTYTGEQAELQQDEPEPVIVEEEVVITQPDSIPAEWLGLEYGYKGYAWGSPAKVLPRFTYMDTIYYNSDSSQIIMSGTLGEYTVAMFYSFSGIGFWKVEIDYMIDPMDMDKQINQFYAVEKSLYEVYQKPSSTNQVISGPKSGVRGLDKLTYERAYLHTSWKEIPCQIELILLSAVQSPKTDLAIISGPTSFLRLIYYNPDYMINTMAETAPEALPSIFDIY